MLHPPTFNYWSFSKMHLLLIFIMCNCHAIDIFDDSKIIVAYNLQEILCLKQKQAKNCTNIDVDMYFSCNWRKFKKKCVGTAKRNSVIYQLRIALAKTKDVTASVCNRHLMIKKPLLIWWKNLLTKTPSINQMFGLKNKLKAFNPVLIDYVGFQLSSWISLKFAIPSIFVWFPSSVCT